MTTKIPIGRPPAGAKKPTEKTIHVRLDPETEALLERLVVDLGRKLGPGHSRRGRKSIVVRQALHEMGARAKR